MKRLKAGIIGLGSWGECHLQAYRALSGVEVTAICDANESRLDAMVGKYRVPHAFTGYEELLERDDIDLVSVVTFEKNHLAPVLAALRAGKHVLVEKPVSTDLADIRQMQAVAEQCGKHVLPGHLLRFDPRYAEIYEALKHGGRLGRPVSIFLKRSRAKSLFATYQRTHTVYELTVHDLDLAIWYAGSRVKKVRAMGRYALKGRAPDVLWSTLEFENGVVAVIGSNWMNPDEAGIAMFDAAEIIGEQGVAHFETSHSGTQVWDDETGRHSPDQNIHYTLAGKAGGCLKDQLAYISDCLIRGEAPDYISFADAVHGIEVAGAIEKAAESGLEILL